MKLFLRLPIIYMALVAGMMTGCGGSESEQADGKVTIRYARWGLPEEIEAEKILLKEFEAAHPNIQVEIEFNAWSEYWNKLQAQMAANSAPDVFLASGSYVHDYASRGQLENIKDRIAGDSTIDLSKFFDATVAVYNFDGGMWALPRDCNTVAIYYNKMLFDKYGVEYPKAGWTWEDFLAKAKALTVDEDKDGRMESYGYLASFQSMDVHWISWVWQNGGSVLNEDRTKCLLAEDAAVEGLEFLSGFVSKEKVSPDSAQSSTFGSNMFLMGRLAMSSEGSWMIRAFSENKDLVWDVAPLPKHKQDVTPVNGLGNAIYAKSKHKDAAWELVKFLGSKEYQEKLAKSGTSIPALKEVAYSPVYLDGYPANKESFLKQMETGRTLDFTPGFARYETAIRNQLELVWLGQKDVRAAMTDACTEVDKILAENRAK